MIGVFPNIPFKESTTDSDGRNDCCVGCGWLIDKIAMDVSLPGMVIAEV